MRKIGEHVSLLSHTRGIHVCLYQYVYGIGGFEVGYVVVNWYELFVYR